MGDKNGWPVFIFYSIVSILACARTRARTSDCRISFVIDLPLTIDTHSIRNFNEPFSKFCNIDLKLLHQISIFN